MKNISCIIIEDEPIAVRVIKSYVSQVNFISIIAVCKNAIEGLEILSKNKVDCVFLDIHLPVLKGIDFLKQLTNPPKIIITTAYDKYAVDGFELEVSDYLLKPFSFDRFLKAVTKVRTELNREKINYKDFYVFNVNKKLIKVYYNDIIYVESVKDYVKIFFLEKYILVKFQLGEIEEILPKSDFVRIHRGFIVAINKVEAINYNEIEINGKKLPVGRTYIENIKHSFKNWFE